MLISVSCGFDVIFSLKRSVILNFRVPLGLTCVLQFVKLENLFLNHQLLFI